jgi:hypothetical protein
MRPPPAAPHASARQRDGAAPCRLMRQEVLRFNLPTLNHLNKIVFEFQMSRKLICMLYKVRTFHFSNIYETKYYIF